MVLRCGDADRSLCRADGQFVDCDALVGLSKYLRGGQLRWLGGIHGESNIVWKSLRSKFLLLPLMWAISSAIVTAFARERVGRDQSVHIFFSRTV